MRGKREGEKEEERIDKWAGREEGKREAGREGHPISTQPFKNITTPELKQTLYI